MAFRIRPFPDGMTAIRISHHRELLVLLHQLIDEQFATLVVAVVVARAVDEQEVAL